VHGVTLVRVDAGGSEGREVGERHGLLGGLYGYSVEGVIGMGCWVSLTVGECS
jgi:hypothetical protein